MSAPTVHECLICGYRTTGPVPRRCPECDTPAARFRLVAERAPAAKPTTTASAEKGSSG